jgi:DNA repair protein RadC
VAPSPAAEEIRDRQILDALLTPLSQPDAERWSKQLIDEFGSLAGVLAAEPEVLAQSLDGAADPAGWLGLIREAMLHALKHEACLRPVLSDSQALLDYLMLDQAHAQCEQFRVLFLDCRNGLIRDEIVSRGSVVEAPVYPREIMRRALQLGASGLILVHNHPSGDPYPSRGDVEATAKTILAAQSLEIEVHDHIILARSGWSSFKALGLL